MGHPDKRVAEALRKLNDELYSWERSTGRQSALVLREQGGFVHRSCSGKPVPESCDDISDEQLFSITLS